MVLMLYTLMQILQRLTAFLRIAATVSLSACATNALYPIQLPEDVAQVAHTYPLEAIASFSHAQAALSLVRDVRIVVNKRHINAQRACYDRFFVNACLDKDKQLYQTSMKTLQSVEIQAKAFLRRLKAQARERVLVVKQPSSDKK